MSNRQKALVVLGAGASRGVDEGDTPVKDEKWRPPLAKDLFQLSLPYYYDLARPYPGAQAIAMRLADASRKLRNDFDLEEELRTCAFHEKSDQVRRWYRDVPPYLRDLLTTVSFSFVEVPGCYMHLLNALINEGGHDVAFVTLNYDTLLEQALGYWGRTFTHIDHYAASDPGRLGPLVKLHGSTDWFWDAGPRTAPWESAIDAFDPFEQGRTIYVLKDALKTPNIGRDADTGRSWVYPVLTAPLAGKNADHHVCPGEHVQALREWSAFCHKILVIGCSGRDLNLFSLLTSLEPKRFGIVGYVGHKDADEIRDRFQNGTHKVRGPGVGFTFDGGFRRFLDSAEFKAFVDTPT